MTTDVLYVRSKGRGWGPVDALADLAAASLGGQLIEVDDHGEVGKLRKVAGLLPRRKSERGLLIIAANPAQLAYAVTARQWTTGYGAVAAWIIDSFWTDRIARVAKSSHIDKIFVTDKDLLGEWGAATRKPIAWAPWGADTFAVTVSGADRTTDLLRIGRQPSAWSDDEQTAEYAREMSIRFSGRPPFRISGQENQKMVREALCGARFTLAFTNLVEPASYTHKTREYVTGRWMDALAAGSTVVGVAPKQAHDMLWEGATIDIDPYDLTRGLARIAELNSDWTPAFALRQHQMARKSIDWRYRLRDIAASMGWRLTACTENQIRQIESGDNVV